MSSRAIVLGCAIDRLDTLETVKRCEQLIEGGHAGRHVSVNAAKLVAMRDDARMREIVASCDIVSADGQSIVWASRLLRDPVPERVAGIDLMHELLARAVTADWSVYFLGASEAVLELAIDRLRDLYPGLRIAGRDHGYFTDADTNCICAQIRDAQPDLLFVAMPSPKKEYWIDDNLVKLGVPFVMGVGGALDVAGGRTRRAPKLLRHAGLEWAFRLAQEPRRLMRRYLTTNARFLLLLGRELGLQGRPH